MSRGDWHWQGCSAGRESGGGEGDTGGWVSGVARMDSEGVGTSVVGLGASIVGLGTSVRLGSTDAGMVPMDVCKRLGRTTCVGSAVDTSVCTR